MPLNLPKAVVVYFAADKQDGEAVAECFTENAIVKDEGHSYHGRAAIKQCKTGASAKYVYTSEPFACERSDRPESSSSQVGSPATFLAVQ